MRRLLSITLFSLLHVLACADEAPAADLQQKFDLRYKDVLGPASQALLPFARLEPQDWKTLQQNRHLQRVFTEPDVFYNNKTYSFTLYRADDCNFYLDAKGGFWGMDQLFYGPIDPNLLQPQ